MDIRFVNVGIAVRDLDAALAVAARRDVHPLRGVARYEDACLLTYLRGPSGILVMLAQDLQRNPLACPSRPGRGARRRAAAPPSSRRR